MANLSVSPFRNMLSLREAMDQLVEQSFIRPFPAPFEDGFPLAVDVRTEGDDYVLTAAVPGLKPEELKIEILGDTVTIRGEVKEETKREEENYLVREMRHGQFQRSVTLPALLNAARAEASVENGMLSLRLPKADEARPKAIAIKVKK
jgi:HSP20 family protein